MNYLSVSEFEALKKTYILRARVVSGSIPLPNSPHEIHSDLNATNFEIIAPYTKDNFEKLLKLGADAYNKDPLTKLEILAWAGGAANHDGDRYLWSCKTGKDFSFEEYKYLLRTFDLARPMPWLPGARKYYNATWRTLKHGFSLAAYEDLALGNRNDLNSKISNADSKRIVVPTEKQDGIRKDQIDR